MTSKLRQESRVATLIKSDLRENQDDGEISEQIRQQLMLVEHYNRMNDLGERELKVGTFAQWKPRLKNRTSPAYGAPVVVVSLLSPPHVEESFTSESVFFREELGLVIGMVDEDGDFVCVHVDGRRFQPADTIAPIGKREI
jgi:hypothetical protein